MLGLFLITTGFMLREENDVFSLPQHDRYYTQGLEIDFNANPIYGSNDVTVLSYGVKNLIYAPSDVSVPYFQQTNRFYAGYTAFTMTKQVYKKDTTVLQQWDFGVVGSYSRSDDIQDWFHERIGSKDPKGWEHQIPNEPVVNYTYTKYDTIYMLGRYDSWGFKVYDDYGGTFGNAFIWGNAGLNIETGWKPSRNVSINQITVANNKRNNDLTANLLFGVENRYVIQNITINGSYFQDGPSQDLVPYVVDFKVGSSVGVKRIFATENDFALTYVNVYRTDEFEDQDLGSNYGSITISLTRSF